MPVAVSIFFPSLLQFDDLNTSQLWETDVDEGWKANFDYTVFHFNDFLIKHSKSTNKE